MSGGDQLGTVPGAQIDLDRDSFLRDLIRELSGLLEDVVGMEEAAGFISVVGQRIGRQINGLYREALGVAELEAEQVPAVMVDLKHRIMGEFFLIETAPDKAVLGNRACPFGDRVKGRPSLCMMTSNVFGVIASENLGYGKVTLEETIAEGAPGCRVVVYFDPDGEGRDAPGRSYYKAPKQ